MSIVQKFLGLLAIRTGRSSEKQYFILFAFCFNLLSLMSYHRSFMFANGIIDIIQLSLFKLLSFTIIPVLHRTIVTGNPTIYFSILVAMRAGINLAGDIAMVLADRIRRRKSVIRKFVVGGNLLYQSSCCLPSRQLFA